MSSKAKLATACAVVIGLAGVVWMTISRQPSVPMLTYSQFLEQVRSGRVASVVVKGGNPGSTPAICRLKAANTVRTVLPSDYRDALAVMVDHGVDVEIRNSSSDAVRLVVKASPFLLLLAVWVVLMISPRRELRSPV
jgi:ATP-dependent Zn protease